MLYLLLVVVLIGLALLASGLRIVPQKRTLIIERLGKFHGRADAGVNLIVPVLDRVRARHDLREQITSIACGTSSGHSTSITRSRPAMRSIPNCEPPWMQARNSGG
jgi:regulator of protease activity HflC (stomatin/prohibitin superfamily)